MRSAIFYPEIEITSAATMRSALLLWDKVHVIVPWREFPIDYQDPDMAAAWELIGRRMVPDDDQQERAHAEIVKMTEARLPPHLYFRDGAPPGEVYEIWPQKLLTKTWRLLVDERLTDEPLANGDYPLEEQVGLAIMAKLADACAGQTFSRLTDRYLAFGLVADRTADALAETVVAPLTLSLLDASRVPIADLVAFRRKEEKEARGGDFTELRHSYANAVSAHVESISRVKSQNELGQMNADFDADMRRDLEKLRKELKAVSVESLLAPVVVAATFATGTWIAAHDTPATLATGAAAVAATLGTPKGAELLSKVAELFQLGGKFSRKQREIMAKHPMAYLYALNRAL